MKKQLLTFLALFISGVISAQVGIGTTDPKSGLDINTSLGYKVTSITSATTLDDTYNVVLCNNAHYTVTLPPAASNAGRVYRIKNIDPSGDAITIDGNGAETIDGESTYLLQPYKHSITLISNGANWYVIEYYNEGNYVAGAISTINCSGTDNGTLVNGVAASGVNSVLSYTGGNAGTHSGQTVTSTGVTGLTATLNAGTFTSSTGTLTYTITGTPSGAGTASFAVNIGGQSCNLTRTVNAGLITTITCGSATNNGTLTSGTAASGVSSAVPYTGGNAGTHSGQTVTSTGVTGLTATLSAGTFASGSGSLTYNITGTPASSGTATFALNIGGQTCSLTRTVSAAGLTCPIVTTIVDVTTATGKTWMDRNLGATRAATSSTDTDAYGDLYQWGRLSDGHQCRTSNPIATLSSTDTPGHADFIYNTAANYDWRSTQNDNLWQGVSGTNNPCPSGYRLPTYAELDAERAQFSTQNASGAYSYSLKLPLAGQRTYNTGALTYVGTIARYWTSTIDGTNAIRSYIDASSVSFYQPFFRATGHSVRCIKN
jgi:uncharacterized protein (TIGR02145 family)